MESLIIYLLKSSGLLAIFYWSYLLLLKKETSFQLNRKFLLAGFFTSALLPLIYFTKKVYVEASSSSFNFSNLAQHTSEVMVEESIDWWQIAGITYVLVSAFFIIRFGLQLNSVLKIILKNKFENNKGLRLLKVQTNQLPFSFFKFIVFNPEKHSSEDLALILEHEIVHAKQLHSLDILLMNLMTCFLWFNPFAWLYKSAVEQNLEFIADRETVNRHQEVSVYQRALLKVSVANMKPAITNQFYQSFIKKRILMLNKKSNSQSPAWKIGLVMPILLAFMLLFNVKTEASIRGNTSSILEQAAQKPKVGKSLTISPETNEEYLKRVVNFFEEDGLILKFTNVEYNNGKIISINSSLTDPVKGNTINYNQASSAGIKPFKIFLNKDGSMGYETIEDTASEDTAASSMDIQKKFREIGENPLYIIDGKPVQTAALKGKYIKLNGPMTVLTGVKSTALYGVNGKNGSIIITDAEILDNFTDDPNFKENRGFSQDYIMIDEDGKPSAMSMQTNINSNETKSPWKTEPKVRVTGIGYSTDETDEIRKTLSSKKVNDIIGYQDISQTSKNGPGLTQKSDMFIQLDKKAKQQMPLVVLNGNVQNEEYDFKVLDPENIANIKVLKGTGAIKKYGKKAGEGVIEITTKDYAGTLSSATDVHLHVVHKDQNDSSLENIRKMIKEDANIDAEFSNIKRNSAGIITAIMIKAETKTGKKASASFSNSEGIPMIIIGMDKNDKLIISSNYNDN